MKITLVAVGRIASQWIARGIEQYTGRLEHYMPFSLEIIPDIKTTRTLTEQAQKQQEGTAILKALTGSDRVILLDEKGKELTSENLAGKIEKLALSGTRKVSFVIGGPYGFSQEVYDRADEMIALSRMTFTHEMARLICVEQLYRAQTIIRNEPYHHR